MLFSRRRLLGIAGGVALSGLAERASAATSLFDGRALDGWIQIENNATQLASGSILDPAALSDRLLHGGDAVSVFLRRGMPDSLKADLPTLLSPNGDRKTVISALVKYPNQALAGAPIDGSAAMANSYAQTRANKLLLERAYSKELQASPTTGWMVRDGAMASTGAGRGVIYTARDYTRFRLTFTMRHVSGNPDHQACVLIFCRRPEPDQKPLDALGGIQFQVPNGGHWDYRPGMNNNGGAEFTKLTQVKFEPHEWSRVEIVADANRGIARMTVAQPVDSKAIQVLAFRDPTAGRPGPIAWQMHNAGLFDEYKEVEIEEDPNAN